MKTKSIKAWALTDGGRIFDWYGDAPSGMSILRKKKDAIEFSETVKVLPVEIKIISRRSDKQKCKICGCTEDKACEGGCHWVKYDLCSACIGKKEL